MKASSICKARISFLTVLCMIPGLPFGSIPEALAAGTQCKSQKCFIEYIARCEAATYNTPLIAEGRANYSIFGPWGGGCAIDFVFLEHSDSSLVGQALAFVVYPGEELESQLKEAVADCLQGRRGRYKCSGPLWDKATSSEEVEIRTAPEPPCGVVIDDEGPALYPMPLDGQWGYVTRDGEWAIDPRWDAAGPFSEGRAAVNDLGLWGVIDRKGNYVLGPVLSGRTPLQPFSQGCATANVQKDGSPHAFFVDRAGRFWLYDGPPEELADKNLWEFGGFSGGRAWFRVMGEGLKESYGWIDSQGKVVLKDNFSGAGEFVNGRAPAAKGGKYSWAYIDMDGNPVLPDRWKYNRMRAFSEGRAAVEVEPYRWMYFSTEGTVAIDHVSFKSSREVIGKMLSEAEIEAAGEFHDGFAPILPAKMFYAQELIYIHPDGTEAFAPGNDLGLEVCQASNLPEFRDGLVQLLVANEGAECLDARVGQEGDSAHYVYLDTSGNIVLQEAD